MDVEDAHFLLTMAAVLISGVLALYAVAVAPWRERRDRGFGFRWVKRP